MSDSLVPINSGGGSSGFSQQGSVDWVAVVQTPVKFSVDVLSRWSKAGVDMITVVMGRIICSQFDLKFEAQKRLEESLSKLKIFSSYGQILWFGFGMKHVLNDLSESEQGAACIALCGGLSVSYDSFFGAQVLRRLCKNQGAPSELTPSLRQWRALMDVCAGSLASSQLPHLVFGFERLLNYSLGKTGEAGQPLPTDPDRLADALVILGKVSREALVSATFVGGLDAAWIAAIAQWMFCLRVELRDANGNCHYRTQSLAPSNIAQVVIISMGVQRNMSSSSSVAQKVFTIPSGIDLLGLRRELNHHQNSFIIKGHNPIRSPAPWTEILWSTFGKENVKRLLGGTAKDSLFGRLLRAVSKMDAGDVQRMDPWVSSTGDRFTARQRHGEFLEMVRQKLPESQECLDQTSTLDPSLPPLKEVACVYEELTGLCGCLEFCLQLTSGLKATCLCVLATTIMYYIWMLAPLSIDESIVPSCSGLQSLYRWTLRNTRDKESGGILSSFLHGSKTSRIADADPSRGQLETTFYVLTGQSPSESTLGPTTSAVSGNGVCIFFGALMDLDASPLDLTTIHVAPGCIVHEGNKYHALIDYEHNFNYEEAAKAWYRRSKSHDVKYSFIVKEIENSAVLQVSYSLMDTDLATMTWPPAFVVRKIISSTTLRDWNAWCPKAPSHAPLSGLDPPWHYDSRSAPPQDPRQWSIVTTNLETGGGRLATTQVGIYLSRRKYISMYLDLIFGPYTHFKGGCVAQLVRIRNCSRCILVHTLNNYEWENCKGDGVAVVIYKIGSEEKLQVNSLGEGIERRRWKGIGNSNGEGQSNQNYGYVGVTQNKRLLAEDEPKSYPVLILDHD